MSFLTLLIISVALAMDSFAVSVSAGLALGVVNWRHIVRIGLFFALMQGFMPVAGWLLGVWFDSVIRDVDHWIAFMLLVFIGGKMVWESMGDNCEGAVVNPYCSRTLSALAFATSIDALAVGLGFSVLEVGILVPAVIIGLVTFVFSAVGLLLGIRFGKLCSSRAVLVGGVLLVFIGFKILNEHIGILA